MQRSVRQRVALVWLLVVLAIFATPLTSLAHPLTKSVHAGARVVLVPSYCTDEVVENTGNVKFYIGSGYIVLRAALHSFVDVQNNEPCGYTWTEGWYICWQTPVSCSDYYTGNVQAEIVTDNNGPYFVQTCEFAPGSRGSGQWYGCNAPQTAGVYINSFGHHVISEVFETRYNIDVVTPWYSD